ncbi:hypothetical protein [Streptomyces sp. TRM49041]|uniref:baeRF2 domain-containing protein n=1 Tax=Streptomyces sp. TRM49041 TaxID=2603216 RepID=UPI0011F05782|nr:hypothetical protein [Streptomyces sp. TRM49041]
MRLQFLEPLYEQPGPVASVYLDTSRDIDEPDRAIEVRRRNLRYSLLAHDADLDTVLAVEAEAGTDREIAGPHGQAIFAAAGQVLLSECLPRPPAHDSARYGLIPDTAPLCLQHAPDIPYAAVATHRLHPSDHQDGGDEIEVDVSIGSWPMSRVAPPRQIHQQMRIDDWPEEAEVLVSELSDDMEAIVLSGDPWAANTITRLAPKRLQPRFTRRKNGAPHHPEPGRTVLEDDLADVFAGRLRDRDQQQLDAFQSQRARHPDESEGMAATVTALQRGQARAVVLTTPQPTGRHLWVGAEPTQLATSGHDLRSFGVDYFWEEQAEAALIRAAAATGSELIVTPQEQLPLKDGIGVLLRYTAR